MWFKSQLVLHKNRKILRMQQVLTQWLLQKINIETVESTSKDENIFASPKKYQCFIVVSYYY